MNAPTISATIEFVTRMHANQRYGAEPYVNHVLRVAELLRPHGEWAVTAGLLHDVVEDTTVALDELRAMGYPDIVVAAVDSVTLRQDEDYDGLIMRAAAHPLGVLVKLADNLENATRLPELARIDPEKTSRLRRKYSVARVLLRGGLVGMGPAAETRSFGPPVRADERIAA